MKVSRLEAKEEVEPKILDQVAKALKIPVEILKNLDEEGAVNFIADTFNFQDDAVAYAQNNKCNFNPLDKYVESVAKIEKLYEDLLKSEREKNALLERMLEKK
jgi:hypothetical protein